MRFFPLLVLGVTGVAACGGGDNTVTGKTNFPAKSAVALWQARDNGTTDLGLLSVLISTLSPKDICALVDQGSVLSPLTATQSYSVVYLGLVSAGPPLIAGSYPVLDTATIESLNPPDGGFAGFQRLDNTSNGGLVLLNSDQSGSVTLSAVTFGTVLADGGSQGGEVKGKYSVLLTTDGGSPGNISGAFDAKGCQR